MPEPSSSRRKLRGLASFETNESSLRFMPSPGSSYSSDGMSIFNEPNAIELQTISPHDVPLLTEGDAEDDGLLPYARRTSVGSTQSYELYTPDEDKSVLKKLDRRLVAFMAMLYCLSFLDRSSE
jgi:hypothetical protein